MFWLVDILELRDGRWGRVWEKDNETALFTVTPRVGGKLPVLV